jgi:hypothetical protein
MPIVALTLLLPTVALVSAGSRSARAATSESDEAAARALFADGRRLAAAGDYPAACERFENSYKLDPGIGTNFNLADCFEHVGRIASAWTRFLDVATATKVAGQLERERIARARAAALEPRLSKLVLRVSGAPRGLTVHRDGADVPAPLWGALLPVDPGDHVIEATAPSKRPWSTKVSIASTTEVVFVDVPRLDDEAPPRAAATVVAPQPAAEHWWRTAPRSTLWLGGFGLAALATGAVFAVRFELENAEAESLCQPNSRCLNPGDKPKHDSAVEAATRDRAIYYVAGAVGVASVATASYLWWRSARRAPPSRSGGDVAVAPSVGVNGIGLALEAAW